MADAEKLAKEETLDSLEMQFEKRICTAERGQLQELCEGMKIPIEVSSRTNVVVRAIRNHVHDNWGDSLDENIIYLQHVLESIKVVIPDVEVKKKETANVESPASTVSEANTTGVDVNKRVIQNESGKNSVSDTSKPSPVTPQTQTNPQSTPQATQQVTPHAIPQTTSQGNEWLKLLQTSSDVNPFRRALKIQGSIGDNKDKNGLNYINLTSQVRDARSNGYSDAEIARAIKKAIAPASYIRTYFDTDSQLCLEKMMQMIRHFFNEKSASEIYNDLSMLCQKPDEKATEFILRALEQRQRVTAASQLEGNLYSQKLIHETFTRTLKTGLRDASVRNHIKQFLKGQPTADEELLMEVNQISLENEEVESKQKNAVKVQVKSANQVGTSQENTNQITDALKPLVDSLTLLQKQVEELKQNRGGKTAKVKDYRCKKCRENNATERCTHCYKCLETGHQAQSCTKSSN